jgi:hypothetical protein
VSLTEKHPYCWYPLWIIVICVRLILCGASPLKTASNSLHIVFETIPNFIRFRTPSSTTIKRWVQKVGYYKLILPKVIANDWMIIIDASIQMGTKKCLLVVGCRQANFPMNRPLTLNDLEILSLRIVSSLNANVVTEVLHEISRTIGKIACICSDRGSDIARGIKDFQITNPQTRQIFDTAHRVSNLLQSILEKSTKWKSFREQVTHARRRMQHSLVSGFLPPSPREKARYMNVDSLIIWAADMLLLMDNPESLSESEMEELKKYIGWLTNYREDISYWNRIVLIGTMARNLVREEGIHINIVDSFEEAISTTKIGPRELEFADVISMFLLKQSDGVKPGERFIGSSEVLESLFGKIKYMEREQTAFGFTSLVLAAIAHVGTTDEKLISKAIEKVKLSDIEKWSVKEIGKSIQADRRLKKKIILKLKKKLGQEIAGNQERKVMGF